MSSDKVDLTPFFEFAGEHVAVGIHAVDSKGKTIIYNSKMKEIEGFDFEELVDRSILEMFRFEQQESTLLKVLQSGTSVLNVKQTYWNRKGQEITTINDTYPIFSNEELIGAIELSRDVTTLEKVVYQPLRKYEEPITFNTITAVSPSMKKVIATSEKAAKAKLPVLLIGESGTGKELIAEAIHRASSLNGPFYTLFCHGTDQHLLDQLLLDMPNMAGGTLYCERIDLLPLHLQGQLHALVQEQSGDSICFIASVGEDPVELIGSGKLLKELYYFFSAMTIPLEPLRKRKEDIFSFAADYFSRHRKNFGSIVRGMDAEVSRLFQEYDWPGNLKELELLLDEITSMLTTQDIVTMDLLPQYFKSKSIRPGKLAPEDFLVNSTKELLPLEEYLFEAEMYYLQKAMDLYNGNVTKAANALGMSRQNLQYRLRKIKKK
ncbi:sigma 54-interacting transcriptional regulator [Planococcus sp. N028]|uniref:Sigma 54-interacting transcriptional regulator n=1 Tax=Planococcus shixiaomingii TaxID=3058393 RepID=A0ABT8N6W6_9BACL|nr:MULTISPECIES: sigma 54-interacting transcriptional regulator [unclassified Planococcus (in: firmicutes)]MDN7243621.1 sigma 54-interacting transcriptional regulator [Planococcus sp. N028]WKA56056.1 sigma 54-interacting transcriptional regulator [Planococcus sp. N022]